ncbi:hypothetical protein VHEMI09949 [[Torrubiella] hemipterigena]|uniref:Uncharacterized protein n=1 Tax=[Torrubiella] hemipterigena TaxID=1531966 RepID=A0A0A1TSF2_9HYPO|nr:hypothetical protein VHEMI09949 [[Torrubiella] hemipterigena]
MGIWCMKPLVQAANSFKSWCRGSSTQQDPRESVSRDGTVTSDATAVEVDETNMKLSGCFLNTPPKENPNSPHAKTPWKRAETDDIVGEGAMGDDELARRLWGETQPQCVPMDMVQSRMVVAHG